jgi:hypothetical protein
LPLVTAGQTTKCGWADARESGFLPTAHVTAEDRIGREIETLRRVRINLTGTTEESVRLGIRHGLEHTDGLTRPDFDLSEV